MPLLTKQTVIRQLLVRAHAYPEASDSAQGIARWWLEPAEAVDMQLLAEALDFLVAQGVFAVRVGPDGRARWLRVGSDAALQRMLAQLPPQPDGDEGHA